METLGTEATCKPHTAEERAGGEGSDLRAPSLEGEHEGGVGEATKHARERMEEHGEDVGVATEDEDMYNQALGRNTGEEEGGTEMCLNEMGAGLRRRNRHD